MTPDPVLLSGGIVLLLLVALLGVLVQYARPLLVNHDVRNCPSCGSANGLSSIECHHCGRQL